MRVRGVHHCGHDRRRHDPGTRAADRHRRQQLDLPIRDNQRQRAGQRHRSGGRGLTVNPVNGSAANLGTTIQSASGALLTANANGRYDYNPNGAFDYLAGTGLSASDRFTCLMTDSLGNQYSATVSVIIDGDDWGSWYPPYPTQ